MGVLDVSLLLEIPCQGLYIKTYTRSVENAIRRKSKPFFQPKIESVESSYETKSIIILFAKKIHNDNLTGIDFSSNFILYIYIYIYIHIYIYIYIYVVHSIRFQTFFVLAFKIVVDS